MNLFDDDGRILYPFSVLVGKDLYYKNIIFLKNIELLPEYRKKGLTKAVTEKIIEIFVDDPDCTVILLHADPASGSHDSNWKKKMKYNQMSKDTNAAVAKLMKKFQEEMGFRSTGVWNIMLKMWLV
uniref:hypothetical protein n=1 Tax=Candidatus Electrothrix sp. TaxID=2170559 RepID=UPI0040571764